MKDGKKLSSSEMLKLADKYYFGNVKDVETLKNKLLTRSPILAWQLP